MSAANGGGGSPEGVGSGWKGLYRVAGAAALVMAVFIPVQVVIFILWPPPSTVVGWFTLFQSSPLVGLLDMDLLLIIDQVLMGLMMLALFVALRGASQSAMAIALLLGVGGIAAYFASTAAFEMLSLSGSYAAATSEAQRTTVEAAGRVMLSTWQGTAFDLGYLLEGLSLLIIAMVMMRSPLFGRTTASIGILLGILSLVPPTVPTVGLYFAFGSLLPLEAWNILIARRFFQLGGNAAESGS